MSYELRAFSGGLAAAFFSTRVGSGNQECNRLFLARV